jgi:hypothetical protein
MPGEKTKEGVPRPWTVKEFVGRLGARIVIAVGDS